jgi:hypothetical protein
VSSKHKKAKHLAKKAKRKIKHKVAKRRKTAAAEFTLNGQPTSLPPKKVTAHEPLMPTDL